MLARYGYANGELIAKVSCISAVWEGYTGRSAGRTFVFRGARAEGPNEWRGPTMGTLVLKQLDMREYTG
jgi:hypothetical protein